MKQLSVTSFFWSFKTFSWNGGELGCPSRGGNPLWYVEPNFLTKNILLELLHKVNNDSKLGNITNMLLALKEYR